MRLGRVRARRGVPRAKARNQLVSDGGGELRRAQREILVVVVRADARVELRARLHQSQASYELRFRAVVHALGDQRAEEHARRGAAVDVLGTEVGARGVGNRVAGDAEAAVHEEADVHPVHVPPRGGGGGDRHARVRERHQRLPRLGQTPQCLGIDPHRILHARRRRRRRSVARRSGDDFVIHGVHHAAKHIRRRMRLLLVRPCEQIQKVVREPRPSLWELRFSHHRDYLRELVLHERRHRRVGPLHGFSNPAQERPLQKRRVVV
mmetsp:Transcript_7819/g.32641  ORF Transcript_7819/g.32641 Transcript_7819/m.32641 type:complete len:265 (-) Transcript_7819:261-1055(-)